MINACSCIGFSSFSCYYHDYWPALFNLDSITGYASHCILPFHRNKDTYTTCHFIVNTAAYAIFIISGIIQCIVIHVLLSNCTLEHTMSTSYH